MKIIFQDVNEDVREDIGNIYLRHLRGSMGELDQWMKHTGKKAVPGDVYQPFKDRERDAFSVSCKLPATLHPGSLRGELREKFHTLEDYYANNDLLGYLCHVFGSQWSQILVSKSEIVRWLDEKGHQYQWSKAASEVFTVSPALATRIRLTWIGKRS